MRSKSVSSIHPWLLLQPLPPGSCPDRVSVLTSFYEEQTLEAAGKQGCTCWG
ncbi:mCG148210 [Mus musculus]|nr:mCG148210 [Mus musculus]